MEAGVRYAPRTATATLVRPRAGVRQIVADYFQMTKPKVQTLLLLTTITTMYVAGTPSLSLVFLTCLGGALSAGGAGAVNHAFDRDIDQVMTRTADRPVASGRVAPVSAFVYGVVLCVASFALLSLAVNVLAAVLALCGFLGYVFVYTMWLKRSTPQNIVIGGGAGAGAPPVRWGAGGGRRAPAGRLGRGEGLRRPRRLVPVRDHLLLDAAALLGALAAHEGRVRAGE